MKSSGTSKPSATAVDRWSFAGALLLAAYFLATNIYISGHRLFWYDEVFTTLTTRMPDWHTIWRALVEDNSDPSPFGFLWWREFSTGSLARLKSVSGCPRPWPWQPGCCSLMIARGGSSTDCTV
jgi:hypothetical protein